MNSASSEMYKSLVKTDQFYGLHKRTHLLSRILIHTALPEAEICTQLSSLLRKLTGQRPG